MKKSNDYKIKRRKYGRIRIYILLLTSLALLILPTLLIKLVMNSSSNLGDKCNYNLRNLSLKNEPLIIDDRIRINESDCYSFAARQNQKIILDSSIDVTLITPNEGRLKLTGKSEQRLLEDGDYTLRIVGNSDRNKAYRFSISLVSFPSKDIALENSNFNIENRLGTDHLFAGHESASVQPRSKDELYYNVLDRPSFDPEPKLQIILDNAISASYQQDLVLEKLSISLVNLNSSPCCSYAKIGDHTPRFPASISKLFWMVALYGQYHSNFLVRDTITEEEIQKMIVKSDNEPASKVVDQLTEAKSQPNLSVEEFQNWKERRFWLNRYFEKAGYGYSANEINITQKNFPVPSLELYEPEGTELQIRENPDVPVRNKLTTYNIARLLFEIYTEQAISVDYSKRMKVHLNRSLASEEWKDKPFNSIEGFLGEYLPPDVHFFSKAGWTSGTRNDAAIIESPDGKTRYILVILGDDSTYADNDSFLPTLSKEIYNKLIDF